MCERKRVLGITSLSELSVTKKVAQPFTNEPFSQTFKRVDTNMVSKFLEQKLRSERENSGLGQIFLGACAFSTLLQNCTFRFQGFILQPCWKTVDPVKTEQRRSWTCKLLVAIGSLTTSLSKLSESVKVPKNCRRVKQPYVSNICVEIAKGERNFVTESNFLWRQKIWFSWESYELPAFAFLVGKLELSWPQSNIWREKFRRKIFSFWGTSCNSVSISLMAPSIWLTILIVLDIVNPLFAVRLALAKMTLNFPQIIVNS